MRGRRKVAFFYPRVAPCRYDLCAEDSLPQCEAALDLHDDGTYGVLTLYCCIPICPAL